MKVGCVGAKGSRYPMMGKWWVDYCKGGGISVRVMKRIVRLFENTIAFP